MLRRCAPASEKPMCRLDSAASLLSCLGRWLATVVVHRTLRSPLSTSTSRKASSGCSPRSSAIAPKLLPINDLSGHSTITASDAVIVECPDKSLIGKSFGAIADERGLHPLDAFLDVLVENGERNVRWTTTVANHRPKQLDKLAAHPSIHMGLSDAGARLRHMAFYNFGLRLLKRARDAHRAGTPFLSTQRAVHRLTGELGEWFGLDAGTLRAGGRA